MSKIKTIIIISLILAFSSLSVVGAASIKQKIQAYIDNGVKIIVDGQKFIAQDKNGKKLSPITYKNTTYVPIAQFADTLGFDTVYDKKTKTFTVSPKGNPSSLNSKIALETSPTANNLKVNEVGTVSLSENASTGYSWHYIIDNNNVISLQSEDSIQPAMSSAGMVGFSTTHVWNFKANKEGTVKITFKYYRTWEGTDNAEKTYEYIINVAK